jgi:hypothetical protein
MTNVVIRILTILIMIPIMCISITIAIIWNCYLGINYIGVLLKRKWKAGIKEVKKTNVVR